MGTTFETTFEYFVFETTFETTFETIFKYFVFETIFEYLDLKLFLKFFQ